VSCLACKIIPYLQDAVEDGDVSVECEVAVRVFDGGCMLVELLVVVADDLSQVHVGVDVQLDDGHGDEVLHGVMVRAGSDIIPQRDVVSHGARWDIDNLPADHTRVIIAEVGPGLLMSGQGQSGHLEVERIVHLEQVIGHSWDDGAVQIQLEGDIYLALS
jgi:hypothetical protein